MPWAPKTHQPFPKTELTQHKPPENRESAAKRGYGRRWAKAREVFLGQNPWCRECAANGRMALATVVDHIIPHRGDMTLFWDVENWQSLCESCHNAKTRREGGR